MAPSTERISADAENRRERAAAYEDFQRATAQGLFAIHLTMTSRLRLDGYVPTWLTIHRAQQRFESAMYDSLDAAARILLWGSADIIAATNRVVDAVAEVARQVGSTEQGSKEARAVMAKVADVIGEPLVAWRRAAQADLGIHSE